MDDLTLTTRLVGDASGLNAALAQGEKGVKHFADEAAEAAKRQAMALQQNTTALEQLMVAYQKAAAAPPPGGRGAVPALGAQQEAMRKARAEANLLANANRQLPMQMTDIVTSIASGMPVWMVAIQQGGQLRDGYGGLLPAGRAVAGMFTATRVAALGGTAAIGLLTAAYFSGRAEADAYARAMAISGNAAGGTIGQYTAAAEAIDDLAGTQANAAGVLAALVGTGRVAASVIEEIGASAVRMERSLGVATEEAVGMFAALGKEPVQASAKLNEQYRYLTTAVYDQIKALKEQGREQEAANLAQQTFAQAMTTRAAEMDGRLGTLQRAWRGVKDMAAEAWDAMLGIGRQETAEQELARLTAALQAPVRRGGDPRRAEAGREGMRQRAEELRLQILQEREAAAVQAESVAATEAHIRGEKEREKAAKAAADAYRTLADGIAQDIALMREELAVGGQLSEARRQELRTLQEIAEKEAQIGPQRAAQLRLETTRRAQLADVLGLERQAAAVRAQSAQVAMQAMRQVQQELVAETGQLEERNRALLQDVTTMGLSARALVAVEQARVSSAIAIKEEHLARLEAAGAYSIENENLARQIELLRARQTLLSIQGDRAGELELAGEVERRRKTEEDEAKQRRESIRQSIDDGILQGFRDGHSHTDVFLRELKAQFARTILSPVIRPISDAGSSLLESIVGLLGGAGTDGAGDMSMPGDTGPPGPRAGGGRMEPYGSYWVGENGPERVRMGGRGAYVFPAHASGADSRGGRMVQQTNHINVGERVDQAQVYGLALRAARAANAELVDSMARGEV